MIRAELQRNLTPVSRDGTALASNEPKMATRVNMMKLVQEIEGFSGMADRRPIQRSPQGLMVIEIRTSERGLPPRRKKVIPVRVLEGTDIPNEVPIRHKQAQTP